MANPQLRGARRSLWAFIAICLALVALLFSTHQWGSASLAPKLGLDLRGGTQLMLAPVLPSGQRPTPEQLNEARDIIVERIDANGVSGAEVTTQGNQNIVVSMPEIPDKATEDAIRKSSQMQFRGVLLAQPAIALPAPTVTGTATGSATPSVQGTGTQSATPAPSAAVPSASSAVPSASATGAGSAIPQGLLAAETPTPSATAQVATPAPTTTGATATPTPTTTAGTAAPAAGTDPNSTAWITPEIEAKFTALNCADPASTSAITNDPKAAMVTCSVDGTEKYVLGPVIVSGESISDAVAGYVTNPNGTTTGQVQIQLSFSGEGRTTYADSSAKMVQLADPLNRMAAVLDNSVIVAPAFQSAIPDGNASITGNFTIESARDLAQQLKFGALPMSFNLDTRTQISPTLGGEQLRLGLLAGLIGFILVVLYSFFQYRVLGLVTVASLIVAAALTYLTITILGWAYNYRLDMAGITGCIVAIGVTADSFIVYFERIRDEVRDGRALTSAVEAGWARARRTILAADGVNFLAAFVLYALASANVRGFAFTLGLTTVIDLMIVVLFTHPVVAMLARTKFFGGGHKWSGLDPERLGATSSARYMGRGRFASPEPAAPKRPVIADNEGAVL